MDKEKMQNMMHEKMQQMCANMSSDEKTEMMMGMMEKMKEGIDMDQMMSKMSGEDGPGGMKEMMAKMMQGGEEHESMMPEMMLKAMMPHCIKMMMPAVSKDKRTDIASGLIGTLVEQASKGMSNEEKVAFVAEVVESIRA
jgi:hypothetical protein